MDSDGLTTISISQLTKRCILDVALREWNGFVVVQDEHASSPEILITELLNRPEATWTLHKHWKTVPPNSGAVGCYFLRDLEFFGSGFMLKDGNFVTDSSVSNGVALRLYPHHARGILDHPSANIRIIDRPALIVSGPGSNVWGHWIVDFLPRIALARALLGEAFLEYGIVIPADCPSWVYDLLNMAFSIKREQIINYNSACERIFCNYACVPTYAYSGEYIFHPFMREFYRTLTKKDIKPVRRICISRGRGGYVSGRIFENREEFESIAIDNGYDIVSPEAMDLPAQFELFASARSVVGEYGSGIHTAVVSAPGTLVSCVGMLNSVQLRISELCGHSNVYMNRLETRVENNGVVKYSAKTADLRQMFAVMSKVEADLALKPLGAGFLFSGRSGP